MDRRAPPRGGRFQGGRSGHHRGRRSAGRLYPRRDPQGARDHGQAARHEHHAALPERGRPRAARHRRKDRGADHGRGQSGQIYGGLEKRRHQGHAGRRIGRAGQAHGARGRGCGHRGRHGRWRPHRRADHDAARTAGGRRGGYPGHRSRRHRGRPRHGGGVHAGRRGRAVRHRVPRDRRMLYFGQV